MRGGASSARQILNSDLHSRFQRMTEADTTALRIHYQRMAVFRKLNGRIEAGKADRNLRSNPRATPTLRGRSNSVEISRKRAIRIVWPGALSN